MLRSARPVWTSSTRAIRAQNALVSSSRQLSLQTFRASSISSQSTPRRTRVPPLLPVTQKTQFATKKPPHLQVGINKEEEKKWADEKLESNPEAVSTESSVRHAIEPNAAQEEPEVKESIKQDLGTIKETFALSTVPKESYYLGLAGTIPYLATSLGMVYLSWDINTAWPTASNFINNILMSHESAHYWLSVIEPVQLGYGAVIISFLGAIHWGLEYAEQKPSYPRTTFRYATGVLASVLAWPTMFMPYYYALTAQFGAFVALYFADTRANIKGWTPPWYSAYRFVLTAIVGMAIMISLIGRAKVSGAGRPSTTELTVKMHQHAGEHKYTEEFRKMEEEDKQRAKKEAEEAEKKKKEEEEQKKEEEQNKKGEQDKGKKSEGDNQSGDQKQSNDKKEDEPKDSGNKEQGASEKDEKDK